MSERAFHQRLRRGVAVFFQKTRFQTAAVHADANGNVPRAAGLDHGPHPLFPADVAGGDADLGRAVFRRADQGGNDRGIAADPVQGLLDGKHIGVLRGGADKIHHRVEAFIWMMDEAIPLPDRRKGIVPASARMCARQASTSVVLVFSIDWMDTGAPSPTGTEPTMILLVSFRSIFIAPASRYP